MKKLLFIVLIALMNFSVMANDQISSVFSPARNHTEMFVKGRDGYLSFYFLENGKWQIDNSSFRAAKVHGEVCAVFETQRNHSAVFFTG